MSRVFQEFSIARGHSHKKICALHEKYGDVVRTGPNSLSFVHPDAWNDIMNRKSDYGKNELHRDRLRLSDSCRVNGAPEILTADDATHSRHRRMLAHAFSDRALRYEHQPLIQSNVDLLLRQLRHQIRDSDAKCRVDLANWLNLATFDIIGDLAFGETFGCLEQGDYHPWARLMHESVRIVTILSGVAQFPWIDWTIKKLTSRWMLAAIRDHHALTIEKVDRRLRKKETRGDFLTQIMKHNGTEREMSRDELMSNCMLLIPAGSESSSAGIASCMYNILAKPGVARKLAEEIHVKIRSEDDITFEAVATLEFLDACINEAMRLSPPIAIFNPRIVGAREGCNILGIHVPYKVRSPDLLLNLCFLSPPFILGLSFLLAITLYFCGEGG